MQICLDAQSATQSTSFGFVVPLKQPRRELDAQRGYVGKLLRQSAGTDVAEAVVWTLISLSSLAAVSVSFVL
jgi:hypothetical protein